MTRVAALSHPPHGNVVEIRPWRTQPFVPRARLVRRLSSAGTASLAALVAPSGYGKTTLLREWVEADPRPHAWLTLRAALDKRAPLRQAIAALLPAEPFVLVLDDFDVLTDRMAVAVVTDLVDGLGPGSLVAVA